MATMTKKEISMMQIKRIEKEIRDTPYHKGTEHHIGRLRARLAKLKDSVEERESRRSGGGGGYALRKQGDATIVLVGPPSSGKSTLINSLTNAQSKVAPYAFTTVTVIPGMMKYKDSYIQILDVPGLIEGAETGKGRGREVLSVVRGVDLVIIISDVQRVGALDRITRSLEENGIRINKESPNVSVEKKPTGGLIVHSNIKQDLDKETIKEVASEMGIKNAQINIKEKLTMDRLIDAFSKNRVYIPAIYVVNKIDLQKRALAKINILEPSLISADRGIGIEELKERIWESLGFVRVYLIKPDEEPNMDNPIVMKSRSSLKDVAKKIGSEFAENKQRAKIWGKGAKFPAQEVSLNTKVEEGMMVRFV